MGILAGAQWMRSLAAVEFFIREIIGINDTIRKLIQSVMQRVMRQFFDTATLHLLWHSPDSRRARHPGMALLMKSSMLSAISSKNETGRKHPA